MTKFKTSLQTMVIHEAIDTLGVYEAVRKVKEIGYNSIEISGHFECNQEMVNELCRARDDFGVEICALSVSYSGPFRGFNPFRRNFVPNRLPEDFDKVVAFCKQLGCRYVRYAGLPASISSFEDLKKYFEYTEEICLRLEKEGIKLCMHNHDTEFIKYNGKTAFAWSVELAPHLNYEFDVLGAAHAGTNLLEDMQLIKGRMPLIHFEDIKVIPKPATAPGVRPHLDEYIVGCPLGEGNVPVKSFCDTAMECGNEYFIIEVSNFFGVDPYDGLKLAADNLKAAGYADTF